VFDKFRRRELEMSDFVGKHISNKDNNQLILSTNPNLPVNEGVEGG
jgi:hypothetical protein